MHRDGADAMVRTVRRLISVQHRDPVIGQVLGHLTGSADAARTNVARYGGIEGVAAYHVVQVRSIWCRPHKRVEVLQGEYAVREA